MARALITRPRIVLADEPTGALDSKTSIEVMELLKKLNAEEHITQIIVTHDPTVAEQTNRIIRIKDGVIE
jgi:putative ABC transport system ATP-binding protein